MISQNIYLSIYISNIKCFNNDNKKRKNYSYIKKKEKK